MYIYIYIENPTPIRNLNEVFAFVLESTCIIWDNVVLLHQTFVSGSKNLVSIHQSRVLINQTIVMIR